MDITELIQNPLSLAVLTMSAGFALLPLATILLTGAFFIGFLQKQSFGQFIREDGPQSHQKKAGTPTGGGILMLLSMVLGVAVVMLIQWRWPFHLIGMGPSFWAIAAPTLLLALLGFTDDYRKIVKRHNKGITGYTKLAIQILAGLLTGIFLLQAPTESGHTPYGTLHLFGIATWPMDWLYPVFTALVVTATSNAVNLTDGLDGLAASTLSVSFICTLLVGAAWASSHYPLPDGLGAGLLFSALSLGACLGFLWFNRHPARIFMGDTGSLALGGALAAICLALRLDFWLLCLGGLYVVETLSVMLQVASFKLTGKRLFRMAPLHHHFELLGWSETRVVITFLVAHSLVCLGATGTIIGTG
ncbi:MAG: phospho-N-acetylmuramoyl-pentapeptide-transferase [Candidatus Melainabacteria bacterium]|nr:phospho-N-acetylmuramoyl-pentapeptide-transferase [Candidatus Melainabacteria bacterium]